AVARVSRALAKGLQGDPRFVYVANGDAQLAGADRELLFAQRYVLSPDLAAARFERAGLAAALERGSEMLASPAGAFVRRTLPADPTGEFLRVLGLFEGQARTSSPLRVRMWRDRRPAAALVQTAAPGFDLDAQQANLAAIERAFSAARAAAGVEGAALKLSGPALFAVRSRDTIRRDVQRLSAAATVLVAALLVVAFRSAAVLGLAFAPVATGALAGVAAVALWVGAPHRVTPPVRLLPLP